MQAEPVAVLLSGKTETENALELLFADAMSGVGDAHYYSLRVALGLDPQLMLQPAVGHCFQGVLDQVVQDLDELRLFGGDRGQRRKIAGHMHPLLDDRRLM